MLELLAFGYHRIYLIIFLCLLEKFDLMICCTDWGVLVDVVGFCFLNLGLKYLPQKEFVQWIQAGPKPIYIGFGSMV